MSSLLRGMVFRGRIAEFLRKFARAKNVGSLSFPGENFGAQEDQSAG